MDEATRELARREDPEVRADLARRHLRGGEPEAALETLGAAARADPAEVHALRCEALCELERFPQAAAVARAARRLDPLALAEGLLARLRDALAPALRSAPAARGEEGEAPRWERLLPLAALGPVSAELLAEAACSSSPLERQVAALHEAHAPGLTADPDPLTRALAQEGRARALTPSERLAQLAGADGPTRLVLAHDPSLEQALAGDANPMIRYVAQGSPPAPPLPREPMPTRLFSAHGRDFQTGTFLSLEGSTELRLRALTQASLRLIDELLGGAFPWAVRGRGYGLGRPSDAPLGDLPERVELIGRLGLLPFALTLGRGHMFDVLAPEGEEGEDPDAPLVRFFASDLSRHPARLEAGPDHPQLYAQLLSRYPPGKPLPPPPADLLAAAEARYSSVGARALARFVELAQQPPRRPRRGPKDPFRT